TTRASSGVRASKVRLMTVSYPRNPHDSRAAAKLPGTIPTPCSRWVSSCEVGGKMSLFRRRWRPAGNCSPGHPRRPAHEPHASEPRTASRGRAHLPDPPPTHRRRPAAARQTPGQQARPPAARRHGIRGPRPGPPHRGRSPQHRPGRAEKKGYQGSSTCCPGCAEAAKFQRWQSKTFLSALGTVLACRAYYYCRHCRQGHCPWDRTLGLQGRDLTPAAVQLTALAGVLTSFGEARAKVLPKLAGLRLAESTVQRVTEAAGQRLQHEHAHGRTYGPPAPWDWDPDARGRRCAYLSLDATGVGQQGPGGTAAEGRMAYVGMIFNPRPAVGPGATQARYLAGLYDLGELGVQLRRQGVQV